MTTPNDAARPKLSVYSHLGGDDGESEYHFSGKVPPGSYVVVKDTDYDKLREEVERLRVADKYAASIGRGMLNEIRELRVRAEAAEAKAANYKTALQEIANFKGDPGTTIRNSVKKSAIARRALNAQGKS